jgi:hypothetical protein
MAYIGKQPTIGNFQKCDAISVVNGQATYGLTVNSVAVFPESANHVLCSLNGILQAPTDSFTISSSNIVFASNLSTGDVIDFVMILGSVLDLGVPSDNTVSASKLTNDIISGQTALTSEPADTDEFLVSDAGTIKRIDYSLIKGGGITEADMFRLTANKTGDGDLTANFERVDDASFSKIGTGMSQSSGIFTFPSTGLYQVMTHSTFQPDGNGDTCKMNIKGTTDNSSYDDLAVATYGDGSARETTTTTSTFINVTNVSNVKVKFTLSSMSGSSFLGGNTLYNKTCFVFIRLGDSQ